MTEPDDHTLAATYRPRLEAELTQIEGASRATATARRPVELDQQSVGRLSRMDALQNQAMAEGAEGRRQARTRAIRAALVRLTENEFGDCTECGDFIGTRRLDLDATVMRCVECSG